MPLTATTSTTAAGVQFFLDGQPLGFGFTPDAGAGTSFSFAAYGTLDGGWSTSAVANGNHELSCRGWSSAGLGEVGAVTPVAVGNRSRAQLTTPADQVEVGGVVEVTAVFSGPQLPTAATFRMDDEILGTGECSSGPRHTAVCTYAWDSVATTTLNHWDMPGGLRVLTAEATIGGQTVRTQPVRSIVNIRSDAEMLLSEYEMAGLGRVGRDGGWSITLPGDPTKDFITFGDGIYRPITGPQKAEDAVGRWGNTSVVTESGTGLYGLLNEVPNRTNDPVNAPALTTVKPAPGVLKNEDGTDCSEEGGLAWSTGVVPKPNSDHVLMTYWGMCSRPGDWPLLQVFGIADWDPVTNEAVMHNVFVKAADAPGNEHLPSQMQLASPSTDGDYLYFWRPDAGALYLARVKIPTSGDAEPWTDPSEYEYRNVEAPGGWKADPLAATNLMPETSLGGNVDSVLRATNLPGQPWLMITHPDSWDTGIVNVYLADEPGAPWRPVPEWQNLVLCESCGHAWENGIYVVYSHPERSTAFELLFTFSDRTTGRVMQKTLPIPASMR
ncbi:hypothetical protein ACQBAU_07655 [Propionibacteriaceae bacterium Y2011]